MPNCQYCRREILPEDVKDCVRYTAPLKKGLSHKSRYYFVCKACSNSRFSFVELFTITLGIVVVISLLLIVAAVIYYLISSRI